MFVVENGQHLCLVINAFDATHKRLEVLELCFGNYSARMAVDGKAVFTIRSFELEDLLYHSFGIRLRRLSRGIILKQFVNQLIDGFNR